MMPVADYLIRMRDGTIKQFNPFTGTEVWTVPGRGHRPLGEDNHAGAPLDPATAHRSIPPGTASTAPSAKAGCSRRRRRKPVSYALPPAGKRSRGCRPKRP